MSDTITLTLLADSKAVALGLPALDYKRDLMHLCVKTGLDYNTALNMDMADLALWIQVWLEVRGTE